LLERYLWQKAIILPEGAMLNHVKRNITVPLVAWKITTTVKMKLELVASDDEIWQFLDPESFGKSINPKQEFFEASELWKTLTGKSMREEALQKIKGE
jgi:hypothetical protein